MSNRRVAICIVVMAIFTLLAVEVWPAAILFDATKREMAGNADWVIDADAWNNNLPAYGTCPATTPESNPSRYPTPAQSGITPSTTESYWTGGISAWAVELAKAGHTIESLPNGGRITYGDGTNLQDLSNYKVFIVVEPQNPFTVAEKSAILAFVNAGGGLFMVGDHETSDRDCDGWDSPAVWNDLMSATSADKGIFGIWMRVDGLSTNPSEDWFDDGTDNNVTTDPTDPIIHGPFGDGSGGLGFFGATSMDIDPAKNSTVKAHVWRTGQTHDNNRVTFATASYGAGRVAAIGDSSPADDNSGDPGDNLYPGWDLATGGVKNKEIHMNATHWLTNPAPDTAPPIISAGPSATASDCSAVINWTTDEAATTLVDYGPTSSYGSQASVAGYTMDHSVTITGLTPSATYHFRVSSSDASGNGPTQSSDSTFATSAAAAPAITVGPASSSVTGMSAIITWTTNESATSQVDYGTTASYGSTGSTAGYSTSHSVTLSGLTPTTTYHYRAVTTDSCGNGPTYSGDFTFTTGAAAIDVSGWVIKQYNSAQTDTIPAGTTIPSGGYLVVGRNDTRAQFEAVYTSMPAGTVYLNSNQNGSCTDGCFPMINGAETFELYNASNGLEDGMTIAMAAGNTYQRKNPGDAAGSSSSWTTVAMTSANPGQGAGAQSGAGVVINEMSDASAFANEFIELYYDAGSSPADTVPPATITNLSATPLSDTQVQLNWTASGDDGTTGTATTYDIRRSSSLISDETAWAAATQLTGEPTPAAAGAAETMAVTGLTANTTYYFAMKVADEVPNWSGLSNCASATTSAGGGSTPVNHLVISQFDIAGSSTDIVELYNPTSSPISLSGYSIRNLSYSGGSGFTVALNATKSVPAYGWYLVAYSGYAGSPASDESLFTSVNNFSATRGHILLMKRAGAPVATCTDADIVDKVGYAATAVCPEGGSGKNTAVPLAGQSVTRKPGGDSGSGQDTDVNSDDFLAAGTPNFHNSSSPPVACPAGTVGNVGSTLYLTSEVSGTQFIWANASGATGYKVYRGTSGDFADPTPPPESLWKSPTTNSETDTQTPSAVFFYVVHAVNGSCESAD